VFVDGTHEKLQYAVVFVPAVENNLNVMFDSVGYHPAKFA